MLLFKRDDITYVCSPIIEPRLNCVRVKIYIHFFLKIKKQKKISPSDEFLDILAKQSESAFVSNSWVLNRVNGSAQRRSLALEVAAFAAEGLLVWCFLRMCLVGALL